MKKSAALAIFALAIIVFTIPSIAGPFARQNRAAAQAQKKAANIPPADLINGFYVNRIQAGVDLTDEQFGKIAPFLLKMLKERREITARRTRLLNQLRQTTARAAQEPRKDATDEEIGKITHDLDQAEVDRFTSQQEFLKSVDPLLNERQRARLRIFQDNIEKTIINLLNSIQAPAAPAPPPPAAVPGKATGTPAR